MAVHTMHIVHVFKPFSFWPNKRKWHIPRLLKDDWGRTWSYCGLVASTSNSEFKKMGLDNPNICRTCARSFI